MPGSALLLLGVRMVGRKTHGLGSGFGIFKLFFFSLKWADLCNVLCFGHLRALPVKALLFKASSEPQMWWL